jgi:hypothetical protein
VIGNDPIEMDFGRYVRCLQGFTPDQSKDEKAKFSKQLIKWAEESTPLWKDEIALHIMDGR